MFERKAAQQGFELTHLPPARGEGARDALRAAVGDGEYFLALLPDGSRLVHPIAYGACALLGLLGAGGLQRAGGYHLIACAGQQYAVLPALLASGLTYETIRSLLEPSFVSTPHAASALPPPALQASATR